VIKRSRDAATTLPIEWTCSNMIHDEQSESKQTIMNDPVTLHDVSAIEKAVDTADSIEHGDLSVSLLPFIPTGHLSTDNNEHKQEQQNKSIVSTISDKTFVKTSSKGFSSDEDTYDDDDDDDDDNQTMLEDSFIHDPKEMARPLLLTADRTIRRTQASTNQAQHDQPVLATLHMKNIEIEEENTDVCQPSNVEVIQPRTTFLLNTNTFDTNTSNVSRPTIHVHDVCSTRSSIECSQSYVFIFTYVLICLFSFHVRMIFS
jgi:hypothetical protein